jgi:DNA-binding CsgD family transcriptional regulator
MALGSVVAASVDRLAALRPREPVGYAGALATVGAAILLLELYLADLDHGTHLLFGLVMVGGAALLFGPGPATSSLVLGGGASVAVPAATVGGILGSPDTYLQLAVFFVAGAMCIGLASMAIRARSTPRPLATTHGGPMPPTAMVEALTDRELEILRLAASGIAVEEISARLFVSPNTVKTHLTHVYAKLGVRGRPDAIRAALHYGCLTPADICPHRYPPEAAESPLSVSAQRRNG